MSTTKAARYTTQLGRAAHSARPGRESLSKRLGVVAVRAIHARDGGKCVYCRATRESSGAALHLDHIVPAAKGGKDKPGNLITACIFCNSQRKTMSLAQWADFARATRGLVIDPAAVRAQARRLPRAILAIEAR
jgi:5-methylcytosine-specific restriction endonuclease McrA